VLKATRRAPTGEADGDIEQRIASYRPEKVDLSTWVAIRPFVLDCVRRLPPKGWPVAIRTLRVLTQLSAWAVRQGMDLDAELVFDPDTIERFVVEGLAKNSSRATYRADLRRVAPLLTSKAPWEPRTTLLPRRQVAPPYTRAELQLLFTDAIGQRTPARRRACSGADCAGSWCRARWSLGHADQSTRCRRRWCHNAPPYRSTIGPHRAGIGALGTGDGRAGGDGRSRVSRGGLFGVSEPRQRFALEARGASWAPTALSFSAAFDVAVLAPEGWYPAARTGCGRRSPRHGHALGPPRFCASTARR
jgi:hypothetical protein